MSFIADQIIPERKPPSLKRRVGRFSMDVPFLEDHETETAIVLLDGCIVVRAEMTWDGNRIEYVALHADFSEVPQGAVMPEYKGIVSRHPDGHMVRYWLKITQVEGLPK